MDRYDHWLGGRAVAPRSGRYLTSVNPADGALVIEVAEGTAEDVDDAVRAADAAAHGWRMRKPVERGRLLLALARAILDNIEMLARLESAESGKPITQSPREIEGAAAYFEFYGGLVHALLGETIDLGPGYHCFTTREPFGVVGAITPWNAPLNQAARAIAPALAVGNTVVVKPSEFTSGTTLRLAQLATEVGFPDGAVNVVTGDGANAGAPLVEHPLVRKVAFTGSVRTGQDIGRIAAERVIPLTLELGGKSANVVFDDADLDRVVPASFRAFVGNAGQVCSAGTRLLVQRTVHDQVVEGLRGAVARIRLGDNLGPLTTAAQYERVKEYFAVASAEGAEAVCGGSLPDDPGLAGGYYVPPTVYTGVTNDMRIAREEIFGPVLAVIPFDDEGEALALANDSDYGLAAGVWTSDLSRALRFAEQLQAGQVYVNAWLTGTVEMPFGGYKLSGYGREKGIEAMFHYTQLKCVTVAY